MVFPSIPIYLDPSNWNHQQGHHPNINGPVDEEAPSGPPVRPASMADRARIAKVPPPEAALNCPRCESTNTKFCYFNNYSLSQPRHFCKACRRYWTRGGALRNVPVGGGCRRNKRSKGGATASSASKSQTTSATSSISSTATGSATMMPAASQQLQFMPSMHPFLDYTTTNMGLNFGGEYQGMEQWRLQQFSVAPGHGLMNQFDGDQGGRPDGSGRFGPVHQQGTGDGVKMEGRSHGLNLIRPSLSINDQYWNGGVSGNGGWMMDLSAFNSSSSAGNLL